MADITLPVPGESPNWGAKLNTAILRINQELEALGVRVSVVESGLASLTLRVTNLEGRVTDLEDNLEDLVRDIASDVIASDPAVIAAAEAAVDEAVADLNIVQAYPESPITYTGQTYVPMRWTYKSLSSPYETEYMPDYTGEWISGGTRMADVPLLNSSGYLRESQIPRSIARLSDIPEAPELPEIPEFATADRIISNDLPILVARLAVAKTKNEPLAIAFAGSSTTQANPGFVTPLGKMLQETWRSVSPSAVQNSTSAEFTKRTSPGVHIYNAGHSGTTATSFLTNAESDSIAALDPALVAIMVGSNDWRQGQLASTYKNNLTNRLNYLDSVISKPCQFVLVHQYERRDGTVGSEPWSAYETVLREIADARENTAFLDISAAYYAAGTPSPDPLGIISADNIHQTAAGYAFMTAYFSGFYFA